LPLFAIAASRTLINDVSLQRTSLLIYSLPQLLMKAEAGAPTILLHTSLVLYINKKQPLVLAISRICWLQSATAARFIAALAKRRRAAAVLRRVARRAQRA
jgi:hypothetical protein